MHHILLGLFIEKRSWSILWPPMRCYYAACHVITLLQAPSLAAWYMLWRSWYTVACLILRFVFGCCGLVQPKTNLHVVTVWAWYFRLVHALLGLLT